jgi:hypothetical protein
MNYIEIMKSLRGLSTDELRGLNSYVVDMIKARNAEEARAMRRSLRPGQKVAINADGYRHGNYSVVEIRQVKAVVMDHGTNRRIVVPMNMLSAV